MYETLARSYLLACFGCFPCFNKSDSNDPLVHRALLKPGNKSIRSAEAGKHLNYVGCGGPLFFTS